MTPLPSAGTIQDFIDGYTNPIDAYFHEFKDVRDYARDALRALTPDQQKLLVLNLDYEFSKRDSYYFLTHHCYSQDQQADDPEDSVKLLPSGYSTWLDCQIYEAYRRRIIFKSRQIARTWIHVGLHLHKASFVPARSIFFRSTTETKAGFGGAGPPNVNYLLGRLWFMYLLLPEHLRRTASRQNGDPICATFYHYHPVHHTPQHSVVYGLSSKTTTMAQLIPTDVLVDELSLQPDIKEFFATVWPGLGEKGCFTGIATPRRKEFGYQLLMDMDEMNELTPVGQVPFKELMPLEKLYHGKALSEILTGKTDVPIGPRYLARVNPKNGMVALMIYWRSNPNFGNAWYKRVPGSMPSWMRRREYDLDFDADADYYPLWQTTTDNESALLTPDPASPVYRVLDFGKHAYCLFAQAVRHTGARPWVEVRILGEIDCIGRKTEDFGHLVNDYSKTNFAADTVFLNIADVAGNTVMYQTKMSDIDVFRDRCGIRVNYTKKIPRQDGIATIGAKIKERVDGAVGFRINPRTAPVLALALRGSVVMDDLGGILDTKATDEWVHAADCLRYFSAWVLNIRDVVRDGQSMLIGDPPPPGPMTKEALLRHIDEVVAREALARMRAHVASTAEAANFPLVQGPRQDRRKRRVLQGF